MKKGFLMIMICAVVCVFSLLIVAGCTDSAGNNNSTEISSVESNPFGSFAPTGSAGGNASNEAGGLQDPGSYTPGDGC